MRGLTILVTFHGEGAWARMTANALSRCTRELEAAGISYEVLCVLDAADPRTAATVREACKDLGRTWRMIGVELGDLGSARNAGIAAAAFDHICIADGDDYYTANWPLLGYGQAVALGDGYAIHPEYVVDFGAKEEFSQQIDQEDSCFSRESLLCLNNWVSCVVASRRDFQGKPYRRNRGTGFGFEDWTWNCDFIAGGGVHRTAKDTAIFYRRKNNGLLASELGSRSLLGPTPLFSTGGVAR